MPHERRKPGQSTALPSRWGLELAIVATMLSPGAALAGQSPDSTIPSLTSDTTYFLFRNDFDYMQTPARLGLLDGRALYSMLTNAPYTGSSFSLGGRTPLGPGSLGIFAAVGVNRSTDDHDTETPGSGSGQDKTESTSSGSFTHALSIYGGYGLKRGAMSLGLGVVADLSRQGGKAESSQGYTDTDVDSGAILSQYQTTNTSQQSTASNTVKILLSATAGAREGVLWVGNLTFERYGYSISSGNTATSNSSESSGFSSTETSASTQTGDGSQWLAGLELNPEFQVSKTFGLEVYGAAKAGRNRDSSHTESSHLYTSTTSPDDPSPYSETSTTVLDIQGPGTGLLLTGWAGGRFRLSEAAELRMGVGYTYRGWFSDVSSSQTVEGTSTSPSDPSGTTTSTGPEVYSAGSLLLPVAVAVNATDHLVVRAGARYALSRTVQSHDLTSSFTAEGSGGTAVQGSDKAKSVALEGYSSYALGLEYRPASAVRLSLAVLSGGDASRTTVGSLGLYSSASLEW